MFNRPQDYVGKILDKFSITGFSIGFEVQVQKSLGRKDTYIFYTEDKLNNYDRFFGVGDMVRIKATKQAQHKSYDILDMRHI